MASMDISKLEQGDYFQWEWYHEVRGRKPAFVCVWNAPFFLSIDSEGTTMTRPEDRINVLGSAEKISKEKATELLQSYHDQFCKKTKEDKGLKYLLNLRTQSDLDRRIKIVFEQEPSEQTYKTYNALKDLKLLPSPYFVLAKPNVEEERYDPVMAIIAPREDMPEELISQLAEFYLCEETLLKGVDNYRAFSIPPTEDVSEIIVETNEPVKKLEKIVFTST
ncbi:hypothetical protein KY348_00035 [Candidatus Woesearchaeota archaeon]|nr:hypothetical protein [Candidatus Woesearchaeota archaeon]